MKPEDYIKLRDEESSVYGASFEEGADWCKDLMQEEIESQKKHYEKMFDSFDEIKKGSMPIELVDRSRELLKNAMIDKKDVLPLLDVLEKIKVNAVYRESEPGDYYNMGLEDCADLAEKVIADFKAKYEDLK